MRFDNWLIDHIFEPFAHWFQKMTGKDNFYLALWCGLIGAGALYCNFEINYHSYRLCALAIVMAILIIVMCQLTSYGYYKRNQRENRVVNPTKFDWDLKIMRLFWICITILTAIKLVVTYYCSEQGTTGHDFCVVVLAELYFIGLTSSLYFIACTPLPPTDGKIRQLMKSGVARLKSMSIKLPSPSPVAA